MPKQQIDISLISSSTTDEIFTILGMLGADTEFTVSCKNVKCVKPRRGPYKKRTSKTSAPTPHFDRPAHYEDVRIVWDHKRGHINVPASCKEMGIPIKSLLATKCHKGSVAFTVKQSYVRRQRADARS